MTKFIVILGVVATLALIGIVAYVKFGQGGQTRPSARNGQRNKVKVRHWLRQHKKATKMAGGILVAIAAIILFIALGDDQAARTPSVLPASRRRAPALVPPTTAVTVPTPWDTTFTTMVEAGKKSEVVIRPGRSLDFWFDTTQVRTRVEQRGPDKVQIYETLSGVDSAEVFNCLYLYQSRSDCSAS